MNELRHPRRALAWFAVGVLVLAQLIAYLDRQVVAIAVEPMKRDLGLTDTQIGWLYGVFALFYAIAGVPLARLADRGKRRNLIAAGILLWSVATMLCGLARSFWQVLFARIGVGSTQAALVPAATSMIGDLFPRERVPLATSIFQSGAVVGSGLAFVVGGALLALIEGSGQPLLPLLAGLAPWQQFFIYAGLPGLLLLPLLVLVREPLRRQAATGAAARTDVAMLRDFYRQNRATILLHHLGFLALSLMGFCFVFWTVSFFTRVHGMQASAAAQAFGWIFLLAGPLGPICIAALAARLARRGVRDANITAAMVGGAMMIPCVLLVEIMPTAELALLFYIPAMFFNTSPFGLAYGSLPVIAPAQIRATVVGVFMFVVSLGMLLGPPLAGVFSQHVFPGDDGIRYSVMSVTVLCGTTGLVLLWFARGQYARSLARAEALDAGAA